MTEIGSTETLVPVSVIVISVQKVTMADHQVDYRIFVSGRFSLWIAPKHIENVSPIVVSRGNLAIAVVSGLSPRPGEALGLVTLREFYEREVRVGIPAAFVEQHPGTAKTIFKPVLKMEFLVGAAYPADQNSLVDCAGAGSKDLKHSGILHGTSCPFVKTSWPPGID